MSSSKELERNMENTEITLNGTDWSNLYIIDYAGGCGGEMMCDILSDKVDAQFSISKSSTQSFAIDSFDNLYVTPSLVLVHTDINQYDGYKYKESNTQIHSDETMKHNLKINLIHRGKQDYYTNILDKDETTPVYQNSIDLADGPTEIESLVKDTHFTKNYVLRSHRNSDWSSFTNAKVIKIYPLTNSHLTQSLMMLKRWVIGHSYIEEIKEAVSPSIQEWIENSVLTDTLYSWQCELIIEMGLQAFNWDSFVEDRFAMHSNESKNSIPATDWVFGTSTLPITMIKTITEIDISNDAIKTWQQDNVDLLAQHGISMTSTKEECIAYFKNYWDLNNIPCVTEI
jgi:hypothetical protein